jgi:hypothetical protein
MKKLITYVIVSLTSLLSLMPLAKAQSMPVAITDVQGRGQSVLVSTFKNALGNSYNKALELYAALIYAPDPQLPTTIDNMQNQDKANQAVANAVQEASENAVVEAFSGIRYRTAAAAKLLDIPAGDDVIQDVTDGGFFSPGVNVFDAINKAAVENNAMFNVQSLLGPDTYQDQKAEKKAIAFLGQVGSYAPAPSVIRVGPMFDVPVSNPDDPTQDTITIGGDKKLTSKDIKDLQENILQPNTTYQKYKATYRGVIAARSIYVNNLQQAYQERVPQVKGKSALELRNEQVNSRLTTDYYNQMAKATPATVARETLFVLAEINSQLNAIRNQNERMIAMNSINGLGTMGITNTILDMQAKQVGKLIVCNLKDYKDKYKDLCAPSPAEAPPQPSELLQQSGATGGS